MMRLLKRGPSRSLEGMRVLITGGSSGIGLACGRDLARAGAKVVLLARSDDSLKEAAATLDPPGAFVSADVTDPEALVAALDEAAALFGGLDAVIANAGGAAVGPFVDMSPDDYRRTIEVTLVGIVNTAHAALPHLERSEGTLVAVSSVAGRVATPWLAAYTAAKHGVRGFMRALSAELSALGKPVQVAVVAPGPVDTRFWQRARSTDGRLPPKPRAVYRPEDVAAEVTRSLREPRVERTVGGAMAAWVLFDAIAPNLALRIMTPFVKLAWRRRGEQPPSGPDALCEPVETPEVGGDVPSRPSIVVRLRDLAKVGR